MATHTFAPSSYHTAIGPHPPVLRVDPGDTVVTTTVDARGYDRTVNTAAGGSGNVARAGNYNVYTGQRTVANSASGTTAGGSTYDRSGATTVGPEGVSHTGSGSIYNANTGQTRDWSTGGGQNDHYADANGNVYRNLGSSWEQHSGGGWGAGWPVVCMTRAPVVVARTRLLLNPASSVTVLVCTAAYRITSANSSASAAARLCSFRSCES